MKSTEMRIKFENLYTEISNNHRTLCDNYNKTGDFDMELSDKTDKMESNFKRLFWSIFKAMGKELGSDWSGYINNLHWKLRNGDIVDFYWMYKDQLGLVPNWMK